MKGLLFAMFPVRFFAKQKTWRKRKKIDEGQITHLICARLKYDLSDFFRGCFGPASYSFFLVEKARKKHPLKKSYRSYFRRAQIRYE